MKINLKNKEFLTLLAGATVILVVAVLLNSSSLVLNRQQGTRAEEEYPIDTVNDGVYTNYEYGFQFEYPEETFVRYYVYNSQESRVKARFYNDTLGWELGTLRLSVLIGNSEEELKNYQGLIMLPLNRFEYSEEFLSESAERDVYYFNNRMKIRNIEIGGSEGFVLYSEFIGGETEPTNSHSFSLLKDGTVITVNLSSPSGLDRDPYREERLEIINDILDSFEFFTPSQDSLN